MILPVESLAAFGAHVPLLTGVYYKVQRQLLLSLKSLQADGANVRSLRIVALFVAREVVFPFQAGAAYVADESSLQGVAQEVLLQQFSLRIRHVTLRATV